MTAISIEDLDNAKLDVDHIAEIANSTSQTATDRLGHTKLTVTGAMERLISINFRGPWVTATAYAIKDAFSFGGVVYVTVVAHTSTSVAADLAAGKISLYQGVAVQSIDDFFAGVDFTAGTTTQLTLSRDPGSDANITVFFGSAFQGPNTYSLTGTTLLFDVPIPVGVTEIFVQIGSLQSSVSPSAGSVGDEELSWGAILSRAVDSISAMRLLAKGTYHRAFAMGYYAPFDGGGGTYVFDETDTTSADNGGTIIVGADGGRWKLSHTGRLTVRHFGAKGDGATNDYPAFQAAANTGLVIDIPQAASFYRLNSTVTVTIPTTKFFGAGRDTDVRTYSAGHGFNVASGLSFVEFRDFTLSRNGTPTTDAQNGIHFTGLTEQAYLSFIRSIGHWHNFRLCATSLSWTNHLFSDNAYGHGIFQTNEDAVAAGMQWEHNQPFFQRSNGRGFEARSTFGTTSNIAPLIAPWSFANKLGGMGFFGQAANPLNGVRILGGFSGEEGSDSIHIDTYGSVDIQVADVQTEINGTTAVGVNNTTPATGTGRGMTITANNTQAFVTGFTALGHSYSGLVSSCPRLVLSGSSIRANGAASVGGERNGIYLAAGRATVTGNSSLGQLFGIFFDNDNHVIVGNDVSEGNGTPIGGAVTPTVSIIQNNLGSTVVSPQSTGWTTGTGTQLKGAFTTYTGGDAPGSYSEVVTQNIMDALVAVSQRALALEQAVRLMKIIN